MTPIIIALVFFMESMDTTIINTAIPAMAKTLMVEPVDLKVALITYLLSLAIFIPISGWLADKFGAKKVFIIALFIFTISSLFCGLAEDVVALTIARFVQGIGGALGLPVGRLIIVESFAKQHIIKMMSRVVIVGAMGMMLGPVIGGYITDYFSWHWIFWVNVPAGLLTIILAFIFLENKPPKAVHLLDKTGFLLFGVALAGCVFGFSELSETNVSFRVSIGVFIISLGLLVWYVLHSRKEPYPIVRTDLFAFRTFQVAVLGNLIARLGFGGVPFLLPLLLQTGLHYSAQISGLMLAPMALGVLLAKPISLPLLRFFGYKNFLIINTFLAGCAIFLFALVDNTISLYLISLFTFIYGLILSFQYTAMNSLAFAEVLPEQLSAATSIMSTLQQLAQSFGVAVSALFIRFFSLTIHEDFVLKPSVFHCSFIALGVLTWTTMWVFRRLKHEDGQVMLFR